MMDSKVLACVLLLVAAILNGLLAVIIEYLQDKDVSWLQTFYFQEGVLAFLTFVCWILWYTYNYHNKQKHTTEISYLSYLLSIFPHKNNSNNNSNLHVKQWLILIFRGFFGISALLCYNIALKYSESGNVILIETATMSIVTIIIGCLFFHEKLNFAVICSLLITISGVILVKQQTSNSNNFFNNINI